MQMPEPQPMPMQPQAPQEGDGQMPTDDMGMMPNDDMGGDMNQGGDETPNQFDSNFDPGVEADENQDPERFIQQLTGKLSTSLGSFIKDNQEPSEDLCKYVAKMIVKQAVKGLDEEGKDSLIKAINMSDTSEENDEPDVDNDEEMQDNEMDMPQDGEEPMNEWVFTKRGLKLLSENIMPDTTDAEDILKTVNKPKKTAFTPKRFNRK